MVERGTRLYPLISSERRKKQEDYQFGWPEEVCDLNEAVGENVEELLQLLFLGASHYAYVEPNVVKYYSPAGVLVAVRERRKNEMN